MAALNGALTLPQIHHIAMRITQYLDLDMARFFHKLLNEHAIVTKTIECFVFTGHKAFGGFLIVIRNA